MSHSTPINNLPPSNKDRENDLVNNILNDYNQNVASDTLNPPQYNPEVTIDSNEHYEKTHERQFDPNVVQQKPMNQYYNELKQQPKNTPKTNAILEEFKEPIFVFVLIFVFNLGVVNNLLAKNVAKFVSPNGSLNVYGLVAKALIAATLFYVANKFI